MVDTHILITGATGLIGFRVLLAALEAGCKVRYTARSESKARIVSSNQAVQKLAPEARLTSSIIPDFEVDGVFDSALQGITHIIHVGSPVPNASYEPTIDIFQPTLKITSNLLLSALKTPSVKRVIITSSIVGNLGLVPPLTAVSAATRVPLPEPVPHTYDDVFVAYITSKIVGFHMMDEFVKTHNPHFSVSHVVPGYVFGRNELAVDAAMMQTQNSSNNFLMMGMLGGRLPFPIHGAFVHIDDLAEVHLRVLFLDPAAGSLTDYGVATKVNYDDIFEYVEKEFPKAVAEGVFKRGAVPTLPVEYDSSETEKLLGERKLQSFGSAVADVAAQYLEKLGRDKA
ncbi:hypothetical protein QQS21_006948 [Conoideocrella luteorostrata]|uniref:NAD-dependent epimerase/dehydratase domain-containing protein n=1 Tax=Conoideocrella luteorostrata TaxID=1105319 RepID=A0AAJ0FXU9_9HYPO|nr:hypothetical protein QQS21_006948 [Conoideocrella luteorostrata]